MHFIYCDLDGGGHRWRLAIERGKKLYFPVEDFTEDGSVFEGNPSVEIDTPDHLPGDRSLPVGWKHIDDCGKRPKVVARPVHNSNPILSVEGLNIGSAGWVAEAAAVMTYMESTDDFEHCIAKFVVRFRDDLPECSRCCKGSAFDGKTNMTNACLWCGGEGVSVMDEAMRLAEIVYGSWMSVRRRR